MLGQLELLIGIGGAMIIAIIIDVVVKMRRNGRLPPGSIVVEDAKPEERGTPPSTPWIRRATTIGIGFASFFTFFTLIVSIFDIWSYIPSLFFIDLPLELNWGGMVAFWFVDAWGLSVSLYNVNYTPLNLGMKGKYVMATGGPYHYIRHPMYVAKLIQSVCIFFMTGLWPALLGAPFWIALPKQARNEEVAMQAKFEPQYEEYMQKTGRFFPKLHRIKS